MVGGASKGLGFAVARALAAEGAHVVIAARDEDALERAAATINAAGGGRALAVAADLSRADAITRWTAAATDRFGGVDLLFANTGGPPAGTALSFDDMGWQNAFELLLLSVIRTVRLVVPSMRARGGGAILVGTSSTVKEPFPNLALSNVMRAGVTSLVKTLSGELAAGSDSHQLAAARADCDRSADVSRRGQREEGRDHGRGAAPARDGDDSGRALRRAGRVRPRRRVPALGRRVLHHRRRAAGGRRPHQGTLVRLRIVDCGLRIRDLQPDSRIHNRSAIQSASAIRRTQRAAPAREPLAPRASDSHAFVRRSVSTFMPGERLEDAMAAAAAQQANGIGTIFTKLGENLTRVEDAEEVTLHYLDVLDKVKAAGLRAQISVKPTQLGLDLDQELCFRNLQRLIDRAERARQLRLDRHGELAVRRSDARPVPPHARAVAAHRHRAAGVPVSDEGRRRVAGAARRGDPARQGRISRAAVGRVSEEGRRRREFLRAVVPPARRRCANARAGCCTWRRTIRCWWIG